MATIASLMVNVLADVSDLKQSMQAAESHVSGFAASAKKAFMGIVTVEAIRRTAEYADNIGDLAVKAGVSTDFIQQAGYAAKVTGGSLEGLANAVVVLQKGLAGGDKSVVDALGKMGLKLADLRAMSPEQQFTTVAAALKQVSSASEQADLTLAVLGKGGKENLAAVRTGFAELGAEAVRTGQVMDAEAVKSLGNFNDAIDRTLTVGKTLIGSVLAPFVPLLESIAGGVGYAATHFGHLLNAVWKLIDPFEKIRQGWEDWKYYLGLTEPVGPAVEKVASSFETASRAATPLSASLQDVAALEQQLTRSVPPVTAAFEEQEVAISRVSQRIDAQLPKWVSLDGILVQVVHDFRLAADQFTFLGWALEPLTSRELPMMVATLPTVTGNMTAVGAASVSAGQQIRTGFMGVLAGLPQLVASAFTGGGGLLGAFKALGSQVGSVLGTSIASTFTGTFGAVFGALLPALGALIGPAIGGLVNMVQTWFGGGAEYRQVKDLRASYEASLGGVDQLIQQVSSAFAAMGRTGDQAEAALKNFWNAKDLMAYNAALQVIQNALAQTSAEAINLAANLAGIGQTGAGSFETVVPAASSGSAPATITVISQLDGREVARNQVRYLPTELTLAGR